MKTQNNLTFLADKLQNGKWMISAAAYEALSQQVDNRLASDNNVLSRVSSALSTLVAKAEVPIMEYDATEATDVTNSDNYAIIQLHGILMKGVSEQDEIDFGLCNIDRISEAIDEIKSDSSIKEVIIDCNSPGGEATGIEILARKIASIGLPTTVWISSQCASAAYWLCSQADKIVMTPDSQVGSVGVYCMLMDYSKALEKEGIKQEAIFAGKYKMLGHGFKPLTDEERNIIKADIDNTYSKFKAAVTSKRNIKDEDMQGLMYEGTNIIGGDNAITKGYADLTSDSITDYLNHKEIISMSKNFEKVERNATTAVVIKAEEPAKETPKETPKADKSEPAKEPSKEPEMKSAKMDEDNQVACPNCKCTFKIEMTDVAPEKDKDEEKADSEPAKDEPKTDPEEDEEKHGVAVAPISELLKPNAISETVQREVTLGVMFGLLEPKAENEFTKMWDNAVKERI